MPSSLHARLRTTLTSSLTAVITTAALLTLPHPAGAATEQRPGAAEFEQQVLFKASQDPGYACFRIPAIVRTTEKTLLAFAEGRVLNCGDAADIDLVVKRSTDGGRTWGPLRVVNEGGGDTHGNPAPVVDRRTGRIVLTQTYNKGRLDSASCDVPCDRAPHLQFSDDDGLTWSEPRGLGDQIRPAGWNSWYATGPVHGIQLTRGRTRGGSSSGSTPRAGRTAGSPPTTRRSSPATTAARTGRSAPRTRGRSRTTAPSARSPRN